MSAVKPNVCQHAKRGICPSCANPMRAKRSNTTNHVTDFGRTLLAAVPKAKSRRRRNRRTNNPNNTQSNG